MILIINEDAGISISRSPGEDSIHIEIGEDRNILKHLYVGEDQSIIISLAPDGFRINV